jgi:hypothetical protein
MTPLAYCDTLLIFSTCEDLLHPVVPKPQAVQISQNPTRLSQKNDNPKFMANQYINQMHMSIMIIYDNHVSNHYFLAQTTKPYLPNNMVGWTCQSCEASG